MPRDERAAVAEDSFDPGVETGYLRRETGERDLDAGAAPFDPGPGTGYDRKRAKRSAKERQRSRDEDRQAEVVALSVAEQELVEERREDPAEREQLVRERQAELERERLERELAERRARKERERGELEHRARLEREERERLIEERRRLTERQRDERRRAELERRARVEAERESTVTTERERRARERAQRRERWERDQAAVRGTRRKRDKRERQRDRRDEEKHAAARRRRAKRQMALGRARPATPRPAAKPQRRAPRRGQLAGPSAKALLALAAVTAAGTFLGVALGLPVPVVTSDNDLGAQLAGAGIVNDSGTPVGLSKGPYFPVVIDAPANYAEAPAKFHASRGGRKHEGQDIFAKPGSPLVAVRDGVVIDGGGGKSFYASGGGNSLVIYSALDQRSYVYLHMLKPPTVRAGETVHAGQPVGQLGCTGSCDGPHLHFEVRNGRVAYGAETKAVDPLPLLKQWPQSPGE